MSIYIFLFLSRYKIWRLFAPEFTSSSPWWNSIHACLNVGQSNLVSFHIGNTALTSELNQPFLVHWKQESVFMTSQPTTFSRSIKTGAHFGAEGRDLMRSGRRTFYSSSQRPQTPFSPCHAMLSRTLLSLLLPELMRTQCHLRRVACTGIGIN